MEVEVKNVEGLSFLGKADSGHGVIMGGPSEYGGTEGGSKPMELVLIALGGCTGMDQEAEKVSDILSEDFEVHSACCKVCGIDKSSFDLKYLHDDSDTEAMCNPIGQAEILNDENTDLNIILGLCVGHDALFTEHCGAPVTTLAVKDRVLAHNPLGAIYSGYYRKNVFGEEE